MRVFAFGTGRCGSVSFALACQHIKGMTVGHETVSHHLEYPDDHIEVNAQLRSCITPLANKYPDARFVHLVRDRGDCVPSLAALAHGEVVTAYRRLHGSIIPANQMTSAARFYDWENAAMRTEIAGRDAFTFRLDHRNEDWPKFWNWLGASGDFEASVKSWETPHNTREQRGELSNHQLAKQEEKEMKLKREDLPKGLSGVAVEVGTHQAIYAEAIAKAFDGQLHLVDPYTGPDIVYMPNDTKTGNRDEDFQVAKRRMSKFGDRVNFIKEPSAEAASQFADRSLDFVYIDGLHDNANIVRDFAVWYPKVKEHGMLAGHDFDQEHPFVFEAIKHMAILYKQTVYKTHERCPSWFLYKNHKP